MIGSGKSYPVGPIVSCYRFASAAQLTLPIANIDRIKIGSRHLTHKTHQGRKTPYGTTTKHHYHVLVCPHCGKATMPDYRIRHTYKSLTHWLRKQFGLKRFFAKRLAKQLVIHSNEVTIAAPNQDLIPK